MKNEPIIGLLRSSDNPYDKGYLPYIQFAADLGVTLYIFSPDKINWKSRSIVGLGKNLSSNSENFSEMKFPFPNVIYDRGRGSDKELINAKRKLLKEGIMFVNDPLLQDFCDNKLATYNRLNIGGIAQPDTCLLNNRKTLDRMLSQYSINTYTGHKTQGGVIIKPIFERQGKGIKQVHISDCENLCIVISNDTGLRILKRVALLDDLLSEKSANPNQSTYLIQKKIDLPIFKGQISDLRYLIQKNDAGKISYAKPIIRTAAPDNVTTNVLTGGKIFSDVLNYFKEIGAKNPSDLDKVVKMEINKTLEIISQRFCWGELGIDIGLDSTEGFKPNIIEINGMPGINSLGLSQNKLSLEIIKDMRRIVKYAKHLASSTKK